MEFPPFRPKQLFYQNSCSGVIFRPFPPRIGFFRPWASKNAPEPYVFVGFCEGGAKGAFWAQTGGFGPQNPKRGRIAPKNALLGPWRPRGRVALKNFKYFLRNT